MFSRTRQAEKGGWENLSKKSNPKMNSQTSMRTEKNRQGQENLTRKPKHIHTANGSNTQTLVAVLNSRLRENQEIQILAMRRMNLDDHCVRVHV